MKQGIHPDYKQTTIKCACGNVIETGSTKEDIRIEICSACHPFYTGKQIQKALRHYRTIRILHLYGTVSVPYLLVIGQK